MIRPTGGALAVLLLLVLPLLSACQKPTSASDTIDVNDFVDATTSPATAAATAPGDGKTYRIVRGNNQPDEILPYQYKTSFTVTVTLNGNASASKYDLTFPVTLTSATVKVQQASGGIVTPPTGGETEHSDFVVTQSSGNKFAGANTSVTMSFDVWYSLPSQQKEALVTATFTLVDDDATAFTKTATINVAP
jgi:hypothetical protein